METDLSTPVSMLARLSLPEIPSVFSAIEHLNGGNGSVRAKVLGLPGAHYVVESSVDFNAWTPLGEVRIEDGDGRATFEISSTNKMDFFRLKTAH